MPKDLPEGQRYQDYLENLTLRNAFFAPSGELSFLYVTDGAWNYYSPSDFQVGNKLATTISIYASNLRTGKNLELEGALLLEIVEVHKNYEDFLALYKPDALTGEASPFEFLRLNQSSGRFEEQASGGHYSMKYSGGPIREGWDQSMKEANLNLVKGLSKFLDCFIVTTSSFAWDSPRLQILREFRERVLWNSTTGVRFSNYYYQQGQKWAKWVQENPGSQPWVELALAWIIKKVEKHPGKTEEQQVYWSRVLSTLDCLFPITQSSNKDPSELTLHLPFWKGVRTQ